MSRFFLLAALFALVAVCTAAPAAGRQLSEVSSGFDELDWTPATGLDPLDLALDGVEEALKAIGSGLIGAVDGIAEAVSGIFTSVAMAMMAIVAGLGESLAPLVTFLNFLSGLGGN